MSGPITKRTFLQTKELTGKERFKPGSQVRSLPKITTAFIRKEGSPKTFSSLKRINENCFVREFMTHGSKNIHLEIFKTT